jgi:AAA domain
MSPRDDPDFDRKEEPPGALSAEEWMTPIDWSVFWSTESPAEDWLLEPIVAAGRQTAIYAQAKVGKSLLMLDSLAAAATGRSVLGYPPRDPITVLYVDLEMTEADLRERLTDLGYGPDDDLSRLYYYQLPPLPPLDSELGGEILTSIAIKREVQVVCVDTMARAVSGAENDADTMRAFYRHTGRILKAAGIALVRLDHQGKDEAQGQRGSSAKADDVDIVLKLTRLDLKTLKLTRTHSRVPWVPFETTIVQDLEPILCHRTSADAVPAGTQDAATALDELDVPLDATAATALATLRKADRGVRKSVVLAALKYRKARAK